jgi:hypothetical protein
MSLEAMINWLYDKRVSSLIRDTPGVISTVQSIHICAIAVVIGSALVSDMRLAGLVATDETPHTVIRRYLPWMWAALTVLLITGTIMSIGEPERVLVNPVFWLKMGLVLFAFVLTLLLRKPFLDPEFNLERASWARLAKPMAWTSLAAWIAVIFCGRWIAYVL